MKRLRLLIVLIIVMTSVTYAQNDLVEAKSLTEVYEADGISKAEIYLRINNWFTKEENAVNNEITVADSENGHLEVKGVVKVLFKNIGTDLYPKRSGMAEVLEVKFNYIFSIDVVENQYMVNYTLTDMIKEMYGQEETFFNCINFVEIDDKAIAEYNKSMEKVFKRNFVFKNKREIFFDNSNAQFQEVSTYILNDAQVNMFALHEDVISGNSED
jgi:hypothetical protein